MIWAWLGSKLGRFALIFVIIGGAIASYFGWRYHQREVGASGVRDKVRKEAEDAKKKMAKAKSDFDRDGTVKRLRRGDY